MTQLNIKISHLNTKAKFCVTTINLEKFLPKNTEKILVKNVLLELSNILKKIYPTADIDYPDFTLSSKKAINISLLNLEIMF